MNPNDTILVLGSTGVVGRALGKALEQRGFQDVHLHRRIDCDLTDYKATVAYVQAIKPKYVFHLAGEVYGIMGNMRNKATSYLNNTLMNTHAIEACHRAKVQKIVSMGTGAVYPFPSPGLPLKEDMIFLGRPHGAEDSYAMAKRGMLSQHIAYQESYDMEWAFAVSANIYGPHDRFDIENGHVTPSLVRKFYEAKQNGASVSVWGNGSAQRDFMYSMDCADALIRIMEHVNGAVNMGSGNVHSIRELVEGLASITGMEDKIDWDSSKPNGQDFREYDLSILKGTGFQPNTSLLEGLRETYKWYEQNHESARK